MAEKIAEQLDYEEERRDVIAYGLTAILQMMTILIMASAIGLLLHIWYESICICLSVGMIRKSTGGAHSKSMRGCMLISVLSISCLAILSRYVLGFEVSVSLNLAALGVVFAVGFLVFYLRVPVDTPNKPIVRAEKVKRLRKQSFILLEVFFFLAFVLILFAESFNRFYSIASSLRLAVLWQVLTLTKTGIRWLDWLDTKVNEIFELSIDPCMKCLRKEGKEK